MSGPRLMQHIRHPPQLPVPVLASVKVVFSAIPIAQIAIGSLYLGDCPRNQHIPIYLIVVGVFGLLLNALSCLPCTRESKEANPSPLSRVCRVWNTLTSFFLFCWFITGNVWIYSIYQPEYNRNTTDISLYCNKTLYLFAFWITTLIYILLALAMVGACCVVICKFLLGIADPDDV
ncbi:uncharacterized protein LOC114480824 [Gouania willdenowi]|uniref:Uncharacterized protein n=1 Tax=Gouania willdenowi TaxID=441366 RepID=A0A8C5GBJ1_GOUWI|nr:transmembrane protein 272 [Gouania willdenowi]